jgi:hypothetical protein
MAPRTKEQQIAYNEKRRAENAAKKAGTAPVPKPVNPARAALTNAVNKAIASGAPVVVEQKPMPAPKLRRRGRDGEREENPKLIVAKAVKTTKAMKKVKPQVVARDQVKLAQKFAAKKPSAKLIKGVDKHDRVKPDTTRGAGHERLAGKVPKHNIDRQIKTLGADSLLPEPKQNARVVNPTMPSAYVRNGKPGAGMLRGKNYQATVTFTPEQFMELKDKAAFWNRSLAEQIRLCVVQQLKSA